MDRLSLLGLTALLVVIGVVFFGLSLGKPYTGLVTGYPEAVRDGNAILFAPRTPGSPATDGGLVPFQDRILVVDGSSIQSLRDLVEVDDRVRGYEPLRVLVETPAGSRRTILVQPQHPIQRPGWILRAVFLLLLAGLVGLLIIRKHLDVASLSIAGACATYFVFVAANPFYYTNLVTNASVHLGRLTAWLLVVFALHFPYRRGTYRQRVVFGSVVFSVITIFVAIRLFLFQRWSVTHDDGWFAIFRLLGRMANIGDGIAYVAFTVLTLQAYYRTPLSRERRQLEWVMTGFLLAIPPYFLLEQLPLILGDAPAWRVSTGALAHLFLLFFPLLYAVGAAQGRRLRFRRFLSRYCAATVVLALTLGVFVFAFPPLLRWFGQWGALPPEAVPGLAAVALVLPILAISPVIARLFRILFQAAPHRLLHPIGHPVDSSDPHAQNLINGLAVLLRRSGTALIRHSGALQSVQANVANDLSYRDRTILEDDTTQISLVAFRLRQLARGLEIYGQSAVSLPEPYPIGRIVDLAVNRALRRAPGLRVRRITNESQSSPAMAHVVPQRAISVVTEIIVNAHESAPGRAVDVTTSSKGRMSVVLVRDFGSGPPSPHLQRPFATSREGHLGLGLTIALRDVERDGGSLRFLRAKPVGTEAVLSYPAQPIGVDGGVWTGEITG